MEINFANRLAYAFKMPKRGDVARHPHGRRERGVVKRIIGLPHEEVRFARGTGRSSTASRWSEPTVRYKIRLEHEPDEAWRPTSTSWSATTDRWTSSITISESAMREKIVGKLLY